MTSELTLLVLRLGFLAVLWIFVFTIIYALRSDLFGTRASEYQRRVEAQSRQQTFAAAEGSAEPVPATTPPGGAGAQAQATSPSKPTAAGSRPSGDAHQRPTRIHLTSGPKRGTEVLLGDGPLTIGRAADSSLVIEDDYTSTRHARIERRGSSWAIVDLDSTNGTYISGSRVEGAAPLSPGVPVRIGTTTFELR